MSLLDNRFSTKFSNINFEQSHIIMKAPLRTVLKNFLDHVDDLEARKKLSDDQYETEFQELKKLTEKLKEDAAYSCSNGLKDVNRPKNRYKDIVPYDFSRVILPKYEGIPGSDYINASYVKGASGAFAYIAAQGPLPNTVIDFWRMIWICDVQVLVMACNEQEAGKFKCEAYFPQNGEVKTYGNISVELIKVSQVCPDFLVRTLLVKCDSEMRDVYQFHYTSWPDHGIPDTVQPILDLVRLMRECQASETIPILIHCSAGCGRTGTLCAVDYVWACLRHGKLDEDFSLFNIALELRRQRIAMIQTKEQYILAHKVVATMFEQQLKVIDCHTYENLDEDGEPLMWKEITKGNEFHFKKENSNVDSVKSSAKIKDFENDIVSSECPNEAHILASDSLKSHNISARNSSLEKISMTDSVNNISKTSESSYSRNSYLSQQSNDDNIPFIDDDDVCIRPNCGRAYLDIPSCDSISKLINCFDPFVDKVSVGTDDSSPDGDSNSFVKKMLDFNSSVINSTHANDLKPINHEANKQDLTLKSGNCSDIDVPLYTRSGKSILLSNRESYPPSSSRSEKISEELKLDLQESKSEETCDNAKSLKKVGKATVVRRPSISKLKALFEKSGISSSKVCSDSKRPLFRHNSHHVSRAGSAPPSLNCMDNSAAVERESILMMVTRKFRSSSVRTEREVSAKQNDKSLNRKSTTGINFKEGLSTLSRTVSFNLNKTFRNYSPTKSKSEKPSSPNPVLNSEEPVHTEICKTKSSETKPNSTWYDKSSLPRAVAIVRPTEKLNLTPSSLSISSKNDVKQSNEKCKNEDCINKTPKLFPFFGSLNKNDAKNVSTMWYGDESVNVNSDAEKIISNNCNTSNTKTFTKSSTNKVLPLSLPSLSQLKKIIPKSPLSSPESPKNSNNFQEQPNLEIPNSKFYTEVKDNCNQPIVDVCTCPIPEEIIIISDDSKDKSNFWPSNVMPPSKNYACESTKESKLFENQPIQRDISVPSELPVKEIAKMENDDDVRPAIPKKQVIGKYKKFLFEGLAERKEINEHQKCEYIKDEPVASSGNKLEVKSHNTAQEKSDLYTNVNIKAMKNIEQIENTLRKNPRAAIIDLTSRDSYSMEEELVNAVKQLSEPNEENKMLSSKNTLCTGNKVTASKSTSKFPGYEVIWPEEKYSNTSISNQQSNSKLMPKTKVLSCDKTGVCYSPPLRRSVNTTLALAKSQSCGNLDWLESDDSKEHLTSPTKMLVNEAVVELNTLLNQLTSKTLSEDPDIKSNNEESISAADEQTVKQNMPKRKFANVKQNDVENSAIHSVTLVTKSYASGDSPKEEEIVFHFPPPPRVPPPPPEEEPPSESFNILCKNGALVVSETSKNVTSHEVPKQESDAKLSDNVTQNFPQPAPRRSKQANELQRSASFSMLCPLKYKNKGYENVFIEKYQTLSRLEAKPPSLKLNEQNVGKTVPKDKLFQEYCKLKGKNVSNYVNVKDVQSCNSSFKIALNSDAMHLQSTPNKNSLSHFRSLEGNLVSGEKEGNFSHYGRILKLSDIQMKEHSSSDIANDSEDIRKKPIPSKKSERAPLPPNVNQIPRKSDEKYPSKLDSAAVISKKLPSRKHEKAPLPPPLLQKCSSAANVPQKCIKDFQYAVKYPTLHIANEDHKLPAVHENIPNTTECLNSKDSKKNSAFKSNKFGRGLSHSQSDVSVFLTLKENRAQLNQGLKTANMKPFMNKVLKQGKNFASESSSDSDSSYEQIVLIKSNDKYPDISRKLLKEQREIQPSLRSYKKEVPIAPPRSKRRGTTEVQYAKVKTKDASLTLSGSEKEDYLKSCKQEISSTQEVPPAVPVKTKGAFEIPEEFYIKDVHKTAKPESG